MKTSVCVDNIKVKYNSSQECIMQIYSAIVTKEDNLYIAKCPELGTISQGKTIEGAITNLQEATELYLEEFPKIKTSKPLFTTFKVAYNGR